MNLPLPRVVADVGPGGPLVTAMGGMNALSNANHLREINRVKAQWAPVTTQAEAASKLAYATMMGPQFMAKMLSNPGFMANLSEDQRQFLKSYVYQGGTQSPANSLGRNMAPPAIDNAPAGNESFLGGAINKLKDYFNIPTAPAQKNNALLKSADEIAQEGRQGNVRNETSAARYDEGVKGLDDAWDAWWKSPEGVREQQKGSQANTPSDEGVLAWNKARLAKATGQPMELEVRKAQEKQPSYFEKSARAQGLEAEGKEEGKLRVKQRGELDDQYKQASQAEVPMQHLAEIVTSPVFQKLRSRGALQKLQLDAKEVTGSDEEKKTISDFKTTALKGVAEAINGFRGRILDKEVTMATNMKISPHDSIPAILGKMPSILTFNEITKQRARIASKIMRDDHISMGDALERADELVDKVAIRKKMEKALRLKEAPITKEDIDHTVKETGMSREQVISRLRAEGRYNG